MANNRKRSDYLIVLGGFLSQIIELQYFFSLYTSCFSCFFSSKRLQIRGEKTRFLKHVHLLRKLLEPLGQCIAPILPPV